MITGNSLLLIMTCLSNESGIKGVIRQGSWLALERVVSLDVISFKVALPCTYDRVPITPAQHLALDQKGLD